jgi:transcriptional regulator with XRE-family HTH domain
VAGTTFGQRVRLARKRAGLSQKQLADAIGVRSQQAIDYIENPKNAAQASRYTSEIARATGVDAGWLAREDGPSPDSNVARQPDLQIFSGTKAADYRGGNAVSRGEGFHRHRHQRQAGIAPDRHDRERRR